MITWGKTIKKFREKLHLTQVELARRSGVTATYISALEHGRKEASFQLITKFSRVFGVPQEVLYWDAITLPTTLSSAHAKEIRLAKNLTASVYNQLSP